MGTLGGSFGSAYGVKPHLLCATNRAPLSCEIAPANEAEVRLTEGLLDGANAGGGPRVAG